MSSLQWKKLKVLGAGSYGIVYLAIVIDIQTPYQSFIAMKSSIPRLAFSLKKEEQIFKSLCEGESSGCQEIIRGFRTEIMVENEQYFINLLLKYARMIVKGLSHIHGKGIVHCHLKSENILLFPLLDKESVNCQLKIVDFELSKTKKEKADVEVWKSKSRGMQSYLSPEHFSGIMMLRGIYEHLVA
ncbi:mitogen-activated protein kinase kinase kinase 20-like [Arachis duranensis]|uniref:Mitogen-activated protein kinase kinase kinase 20-like n=1 Tax=Arachis duranensis TaxID=130453 RepID=A0A6P5MBE3_ARADU|nr:mitogen-activated protein kinase kinase kinase 20-like [Arachis duranensis]